MAIKQAELVMTHGHCSIRTIALRYLWAIIGGPIIITFVCCVCCIKICRPREYKCTKINQRYVTYTKIILHVIKALYSDIASSWTFQSAEVSQWNAPRPIAAAPPAGVIVAESPSAAIDVSRNPSQKTRSPVSSCVL